MRHHYTRLLLFVLITALLTGCGARKDQIEAWLTDLVGGPPPTLATPERPGLLPTPTLAVGADQQSGSSGQPPAPALETPAAADGAPVDETPNPFTGTFAGLIEGDNDSSASLELTLVQEGRQVNGMATLGEGLVVDAGGICGTFPIPAVTLGASETLDEANGRHLSATTNVDVGGFEIPVVLEATLAPDGQTVTVVAAIEPPALCRSKPEMTGTLTRVDAP